MTDATSGPALEFESWAALSALEDEDERVRRFEALGVAASWGEIDGYWGQRLARDLLACRMELPRRFAAACARARSGAPLAPDNSVVVRVAGPPAGHPSQRASPSDFTAAMGALDAPVQQPAPGQLHTAHRVGGRAMTNELRAAEAASHWTVEQYACFCVELQAAGDQADAVFQRYGLSSSSSREVVTETWSQRLEADDPLRARFEAVISERRFSRG